MIIPAFKIVGLKPLQRRMAGRRMSLVDRTAVNARIAVQTEKEIVSNINEAGRRFTDGTGWKPLSPATLMEKERLGFSPLPLQRKGWLKNKWKHRWTSRIAAVQAGVDYAKQHHYGLGHVPKRRLLPRKKDIMPLVHKIYTNFIRKAIK